MIIILVLLCSFILVFFFMQKTAYEMRISDWCSYVCSSDLGGGWIFLRFRGRAARDGLAPRCRGGRTEPADADAVTAPSCPSPSMSMPWFGFRRTAARDRQCVE